MAIGTPSRSQGPDIHYGSDINDYTTTSFTPTTGNLIVVSLTTQEQNGTLTSSVGKMYVDQTHSGSWSWTMVDEVFDPNASTYYGRVGLSYAVVPSSPGAGQLGFIFNDVSPYNKKRNIVIANVYEISGVDTSAPIIQSKTGRVGATTSITLTLDSTPSASNLILSNVGNSYETSGTTITAPTSYTKLHEDDTSDPYFNQQLATAYITGSTSTSVNWTTLKDFEGAGAVALELKAASGGTTPKVYIIS